MKEKFTLTFLLLLIAIFSVITNVNASTEDDGWVEGDYEGSLEEQEKQAQEDWEDAGRPGEDDDNDDEDDKEDDDKREINESEELLYPCPDGSKVTITQNCPEEEGGEPQEVKQPTFVLCPDGVTQVIEGHEDEDCPAPGTPLPATAAPLPTCDGTFQDCVTPEGFVCEAGSGAHECEASVTCENGQVVAELSECPPVNTIPLQYSLTYYSFFLLK